MQDTRTGLMDLMDAEKAAKALAKAEKHGLTREEIPLFTVGEILEIRGGRFRISKITQKTMRLVGVPR